MCPQVASLGSIALLLRISPSSSATSGMCEYRRMCGAHEWNSSQRARVRYESTTSQTAA